MQHNYQVAEDNSVELDEEFAHKVKELSSQIDSNLTAEEYIEFDAKTSTAEPAIGSSGLERRIQK